MSIWSIKLLIKETMMFWIHHCFQQVQRLCYVTYFSRIGIWQHLAIKTNSDIPEMCKVPVRWGGGKLLKLIKQRVHGNQLYTECLFEAQEWGLLLSDMSTEELPLSFPPPQEKEISRRWWGPSSLSKIRGQAKTNALPSNTEWTGSRITLILLLVHFCLNKLF